MTDEEKQAVASHRTKWILFTVVTVLSLVADQATKIWARHDLPVSPANCDVPYDLMTHKCMGVAKPVVDGYWDWRLSQNPGSAFGLFAGTSFARVTIKAKTDRAVLEKYGSELADLFIVSAVSVDSGDDTVVVELHPGPRCERCWKHYEKLAAEPADVCERCAEALRSRR